MARARQPAGGGPSHDGSDVGPGDVLVGRYELLERVGQGGFGQVFVALDRLRDARVAVKVLAPQHTSDDVFRARLREEARTGLALDHPNIVKVIDTNVLDDRPPWFIVMSYVEGRNLDQELGEGGVLPLDRAVLVTQDLLAALGHAHTQNPAVVHRDVKPSNVMVTTEGQVKVVDFGIARVADATRLTPTGVSMGTPAYMAPEQVSTGQVDGRTDLYSTGCLLFRVLTGRPPFVGDNPYAVALQHLNQTPPAPSTVRAGLPVAADQIMARALAREPEDRYQTAAEFSAALDRLVEPAVVEQPRGPGTPRPPAAKPTKPPGAERRGEHPASGDGVAPDPVASRPAQDRNKPEPGAELTVPAEPSGRDVAGMPGRRAVLVGLGVALAGAATGVGWTVLSRDPPRSSGPSAKTTGSGVSSNVTPQRTGPQPGQPLERLSRLDGLVDYWTRPVSTADEVEAVARQVADGSADLVRLSGIDWRVLEVTSDHRALLLADRVIGAGPLSMQEAASYLAGQEPNWEEYQWDGVFRSDSLVAATEDSEIAWWWLRTPALAPADVYCVDIDGSLLANGYHYGVGVSAVGGVRPAFWLNPEF